MTQAIESTGGDEDVPFGAMIFGEANTQKNDDRGARGDSRASGDGGDRGKDWRRPENRRGHGRRGGRRRRRQREDGAPPDEARVEGESFGDRAPDRAAPEPDGELAPRSREPQAPSAMLDSRTEALRAELARSDASYDRRPDPDRSATRGDGGDRAHDAFRPRAQEGEGEFRGEHRGGRRRRRRRGRGGQGQRHDGAPHQGGHGGHGGGSFGASSAGAPDSEAPAQDSRTREAAQRAVGMLVLEKGHMGFLRSKERDYLRGPDDVFVSPSLVQRYRLRDGAILEGPIGRGGGPSRHSLHDVSTVDGQDPRAIATLAPFKRLTSIDPDFHYAVGDLSGDVNLKVLDLLCPIGRGTRGLLVAPPRSGKTILMRKFAKAIEDHYPEVELIVLLIDERPEEATEWQRSIERGQVFVSTNDELAERHCALAEMVQVRAQRLVELGKDVVLLLDSITRLARAYNSAQAGSGRTMSGGLDTRTMEKPKAFFGSARNTETAGSLTILGTTLVDTGSRMDQVIFEEFKGTGNMELVLSRKLADRRIFPAIDVEKSGTRKEEKLISARRLKQIHVLRRVLAKMNPVEAMELLITKLEDVAKIDDFLKRFEVDPEA